MGQEGRRSRGSARLEKRAKRTKATRAGIPYITRRIPPFELASEELLVLIEGNAETLLAETGIDFRDDPDALERFRMAGASVDGERVRFPKDMCRSIIGQSVPSEYTQFARNPERSVRIGGDHCVLVPAYGPPFVHDL
ncbi:MAG: trimethylamine methyltransferase family protein, partial [Arenicellales bacterium]|nr:trimethylamine methyltransferase family protein [Arenicellales bacterium]